MVDPMSVNYNLTELSRINLLENPADAINWWNNSLGGGAVPILIGVIGLILFLVMRKFVDSDTEAMTYSGYVLSITSFFLFLLKDNVGEPILSFGWFSLVLVFTAVSAFLNMINNKY